MTNLKNTEKGSYYVIPALLLSKEHRETCWGNLPLLPVVLVVVRVHVMLNNTIHTTTCIHVPYGLGSVRCVTLASLHQCHPDLQFLWEAILEGLCWLAYRYS